MIRSNAPQIPARDFDNEPLPEGGDLRVFDVEAALRINQARIAAIESIGLDLQRKRVLDLGAGTGHFISFYTTRGCHVTAVDGRPDNVDECRRRNPDVPCVVADAQSFDLTTLGSFDVIHCLGLLYHLENPIAALRHMRRACNGLLILESIVMDAARPVMLLDDEPKTVNQALAGLGSRPSPAFVAMALNRVGFPHVYGLIEPPNHEDFRFEILNDGAWQRDGHPLRSMFVAALTPLAVSTLFPLIV